MHMHARTHANTRAPTDSGRGEKVGGIRFFFFPLFFYRPNSNTSGEGRGGKKHYYRVKLILN